MKKYSSKQGSSLIKTANGFKIKLSKKEWLRLGKEAGWFKKAQGYYDDNFGEWDMGDDPDEMRDFYESVQSRNVRKKCKGCGRMVNILPDYAYCNSCANKIEKGIDVDYYDGHDEDDLY